MVKPLWLIRIPKSQLIWPLWLDLFNRSQMCLSSYKQRVDLCTCKIHIVFKIYVLFFNTFVNLPWPQGVNQISMLNKVSSATSVPNLIEQFGTTLIKTDCFHNRHVSHICQPLMTLDLISAPSLSVTLTIVLEQEKINGQNMPFWTFPDRPVTMSFERGHWNVYVLDGLATKKYTWTKFHDWLK